jgi:hypothetical protein
MILYGVDYRFCRESNAIKELVGLALECWSGNHKIFEILRNDETLHFEVVLFEIDFSLVLIESARESLGEFAPYFIRADA